MPKLSPGVGLASRDRMATWKSKGLVPSRGQQRTSRGQRSSSSTCSPQRLLNSTCAHRRRLLPRRSAISRRLNTNHRSSRSSKLLRQFGAFRSPCRAWYTTPPSSIANRGRAIWCAALPEVRLVRPAPPRPPTGSRAATPSKLRPPPASSTPAALRSAPAPPTSRWSPPDRKYLEEQRLEQRIADALAIVLHEKPLDAAGRMANLLSPARRSSSTTQAGGVDDEVAAEWHAFAASEAAPESSAQASAREAAEFNAKIRVNLSSAVSSASWPAQPQAALAIRIIAKWVHKLARRRRKLRVEWEAQMEAERERETKRVAPLPKRAPRLQLLWRRMQSADEHGAPLIDVLNGRAKDDV